jgi:hypothetical protein
MFLTAANAAATALAGIANPQEGTVYRITCGSPTNATTIAKAGKFANIFAAFMYLLWGMYKKYLPASENQEIIL